MGRPSDLQAKRLDRRIWRGIARENVLACPGRFLPSPSWAFCAGRIRNCQHNPLLPKSGFISCTAVHSLGCSVVFISVDCIAAWLTTRSRPIAEIIWPTVACFACGEYCRHDGDQTTICAWAEENCLAGRRNTGGVWAVLVFYEACRLCKRGVPMDAPRCSGIGGGRTYWHLGSCRHGITPRLSNTSLQDPC